MNKFKLSALVLATSFALTACGGGGGGGGSNANTEQVINNNNQPIYQPATTPVPGLYIFKDSNGNPVSNRKFVPSEVASDSVLSTIVIDRDALPQGSIQESSVRSYGTEIGKLTGYNRQYSIAGAIAVLDNDGVTAQTILNLAKSSRGSNLSALGAKEWLASTWKAASDKPETYIFAGGDVTRYYDNIGLMKGNAVYKGNASRYDRLSARVRHIGETTLNVNFDEKTIEGEINTDDHRRNIRLAKTDIVGLTASGGTTTQAAITEQITNINTQINDINSSITTIMQGSTNGGAGNALGESTDSSRALSAEQLAQIASYQTQIEALKNNIEELKNTGNSFNGTAIAEGNAYFERATGTYRGRLFGPNAEEAAGIVEFNNTEDSTSFSTVKQ